MSKFVLVVHRRRPQNPKDVSRGMEKFLRAICPNNIEPRIRVTSDESGTLFMGLLNGLPAHSGSGQGAYAGWIADADNQWWRVGAPAPTGTYAMVRLSADIIEALTDYAASRALWYSCSEEVFVASTSHRAIPWFLGKPQPNYAAAAWMLSSGSLGPSAGWDQRATCLGADGRLALDRVTWKMSVCEPELVFDVGSSGQQDAIDEFRAALHRMLGMLESSSETWAVPLSGGHDSRLLLGHFAYPQRLRCITWGAAGSERLAGTDAHVASRLAKEMQVSHEFLALRRGADRPTELLDRFIVAGDGRVDHLAAYADGLNLWMRLAEKGIYGVIRGDHGFDPRSGAPPNNTLELRHYLQMTQWHDHRKLPALAKLDLGHLGPQESPSWLEPSANEQSVHWRTRAYQRFRIPTVLSALTEIKAAYCEVANPLLTKPLHSLSRRISIDLLCHKKIIYEVLRQHEHTAIRDTPYAVRPATESLEGLLSQPHFAEFMRDELNSFGLRAALSPRFADYLLEALPNRPTRTSLFGVTHAYRRMAQLFAGSTRMVNSRFGISQANVKPLSPNRLALRAIIAAQCLRLVDDDSRQHIPTSEQHPPAEARHDA